MSSTPHATQDEYPSYNFIGLLIGPRGNTQKRMQVRHSQQQQHSTHTCCCLSCHVWAARVVSCAVLALRPHEQPLFLPIATVALLCCKSSLLLMLLLRRRRPTPRLPSAGGAQ